MDPLAVIHGHLEQLQLGSPQARQGITLVPLIGSPASPAERRLPCDAEQARRAGNLVRGVAGLWLNRGSEIILILPGDRLEADACWFSAREPALMLPEAEARLSLEPAHGPAPMHPLPELPGAPGRLGAAVFAGERLLRVAVLHSGGALMAHLGRQDWPADAQHQEADPHQALQRTRRVFEECRYARTPERWSAGAYAIVRVRAPRVQGWAALDGDGVLALELDPRLERSLETPAHGA